MYVASQYTLLINFQEGMAEMEEKVPRGHEDLRDQKVIEANKRKCCKYFPGYLVYSVYRPLQRVAFFLKFIGDVGAAGSPGSQGPAGSQGTVGPEGPGLSGVSYNRWGRTNCSGDAITVYIGKKKKKDVFKIKVIVVPD